LARCPTAVSVPGHERPPGVRPRTGRRGLGRLWESGMASVTILRWTSCASATVR